MKRREFIAGTLAATGLAVGALAGGAGERFACVADRVFDGEQVLPDHAVVVEGSRVADVLPERLLSPEVPRLTRPGHTLLPGLIDMHAHFLCWEGPLFLAWGVTTIRDVGDPLEWILARRAEWRQHRWPRILCAGPLLDGPSPFHPLLSRACRDLPDAVAAVRETAAAGVDAIKLYVGIDPGWVAEMARESHAAGLKVSMHCPGAGVLVAARSGVDEFHHLDGVVGAVWPDCPPGWLDLFGAPEFPQTWDRQREVADLIRDSGMAATPTFAYWESQWQIRSPGYTVKGTEPFSPSGAPSGQWPTVGKRAPSPLPRRCPIPEEVARLQSPGEPNAPAAEQWRRALAAAQRFVGLLLERGVTVLPGTDTPCGPAAPGLGLWREMSLLAEAGMSPLEALRAATSVAADYLGKPDLGRLRPGAAADMLFVRGDPTERIPHAPDVPAVLREGVLHEHADLLAEGEAAVLAPCEDPMLLQFRARAANA